MKHAVYDENNNIVRPAFQIGYRDNGNLVYLIRNDINMSFDKDNDSLVMKYGTDNNISDIQNISRKYGFTDASVEINNKSDIYNNMTGRVLKPSPEEIAIGNVVLFSPSVGFRKPILTQAIKDADESWNIEQWPIECGYTTTFCQIINIENNYAIVTPIKSDKTIATRSDLLSYISTCFEQTDAMEYDRGHENVIFGISDDENEAKTVICLINEWEDNLQSSSIPTVGTGKLLYDEIIKSAMENQDRNIESICEQVGIDNANVIQMVNLIYPLFNCDNTDVAWGRLIKLLYHELWTIVPRRE